MDLSEKETREKIIDSWLIDDASWKEEYIRREVNSVKSELYAPTRYLTLG